MKHFAPHSAKKRWGFVFILYTLYLILYTPTAFAEERISAFSTHIVLNTNGSATVQEEIIYDFGQDAVNKHGIFREIPLIYQPLGKTTEERIEISSISVSDGSGVLRSTKEEGGGNLLKLRIGDADKLVSGPQRYVIRYTVWGGFGQLFDRDEFYWNMTGNGWRVPIDYARAEIVLPTPIQAESLHATCNAGSAGATTTCSFATTTQGAMPGTIAMYRFEQRDLGPYQGLTTAVGVPKGTIIFEAPTRAAGKKYSPTPELVRWWEKSLFDISLALPLLVFGIMFNIWWTRGRDPRGRGTIIAEYDVPENLSPLESAALAHGSITPEAISATIIDLAERGYLKIERITEKGLIFDSTDYVLTKLTEKYAELSLAEKLIMQKLFEVDCVRVSELKHKLTTLENEISGTVFRSLTDKKYFVENPQKVRSTYLAVGVIFIIFSFIISAFNFSLLLCGFIIFGFSWIMPKMTQEGALLNERLAGFKKYLSVAEKDRINFANAPEKDPTVFEKFLPYAMIFGVEEAWAKQFEGMYTTDNAQNHWYSGSGPLSASLFANEMSSFATTTNTAFSSAGGGASGGGGFSGGGRGGGGGGSW
jgi:uncharacterized membrane protein YgcG